MLGLLLSFRKEEQFGILFDPERINFCGALFYRNLSHQFVSVVFVHNQEQISFQHNNAFWRLVHKNVYQNFLATENPKNL